MVIFGATGDLTKTKLIPALQNLQTENLLPDNFAILGVSRGELDTEAFHAGLTSPDAPLSDWVRRRLHYLRGDASSSSTYTDLTTRLAELDNEFGTRGNYLFYLATAPQLFSEIVQQLGQSGLARQETGWRRVIIEKPFGRDLESAQQLNQEIKRVLEENQIYRIDHYLGKETVQNILVFRFGNGIFEPIWDRRYVDHVQITAAEAEGIDRRGAYYDSAGALRDMVPNHLFQLITLTAMEPPISFEADAVRDEQTKILNAMQTLTEEDVLKQTVRGQYGSGSVDGKQVAAYRSEDNVPRDSNTETFVAMQLSIDNWRWAGVPFYLRTGKRLARRFTEIVIQFKRPPFMLFRNTPVDDLTANRLVLHIQPSETISLRFSAKVPGPVVKLGTVDMDFDYVDYFGCTPSTGYERLLYDCMGGDATLFQRADMVESAWRIVAPIQRAWGSQIDATFPNYEAGSNGPAASDHLLERDGRKWQ